MSNDFEIKNGVLVKYHGSDAHVVIPDSVTAIKGGAFWGCASLASVVIPDSVTEIGNEAFSCCTSLTSVIIPDSVTKIGEATFYGCTSLSSVVIPNSVTKIGERAFEDCTNLSSVIIPDSVTEIGLRAFKGCTSLSSVVIPDSVTEIGSSAFQGCTNLTSIVIPDSVTEIRKSAFKDCTSLTSVDIPDSVTEIDEYAFYGCTSLTSVNISDSVTEIGWYAFDGCTSLSSVVIPNSVTKIGGGTFEGCTSLTSVVIPDSVTKIEWGAFEGCTSLASIVISDSVKHIHELSIDRNTTIICGEGSYAHRFCIEHHYTFLFNFQYEAFGGLIPPGVEMLSSPFLADEKKPYVFISYSHKDRDRVLPILKTLYEAGWRIWYDEGLTIGDSYDETLEKHVRNCSAFLLFVTDNSLNSLYIEKNEVPWAIRFKKPIVKCSLNDGEDYEISKGSVIATVSPSEIEPALAKISGLKKGKPRTAKGITVAVDPANRSEAADGNGFAYCLYAPKSAATAKAILFEAKSGGCALYDAVENGEDKEKLQNAASLIVFLDKTFLSDQALTNLLIEAYQAGKDITVCRLEDVEAGDFPPELRELDKMHALNFVHGITPDMNKKLVRHLQKRGCRNASALPGFEYEKTDEGIVIKKYTGTDPEPKLEREYGGIPVAAIAAEAFIGCVRLKKFIIPDGVTEIGYSAFKGCTSLTSVIIPDSVTEIGKLAFEDCKSLSSVVIPNSVTKIGNGAFSRCASLSSVVIPDSVIKIDDWAFKGCTSLSSIDIPKSVKVIGSFAFEGCSSLMPIVIPDSVTIIREYAFRDCSSLTSIVIPNSITGIERGTFKGCKSLTSVVIPKSVTEIGQYAFDYCTNLSFVVIPKSVKEIDSFAFESCTSLTSVVIPNSVKKIEWGVFLNCKSITVFCPRFSYAWKYCKKNKIPVKSIRHAKKQQYASGSAQKP